MKEQRGDRSMPPSDRLAGILRSRNEVLRQHAADARRGTVTGVHQARVATRRLREVVPVAAVHLEHVRRRRLRRALRRMTRALGAVRDCDVALQMVADLRQAAPRALRPELRAWIATLRLRRRAARERLLDVLQDKQVQRVGRWVDDLAAARAASPDDAWRRRLARLLEVRALALHQTVDAAGVLFAPEALHEVRIAAKRLRYAIEIVGECRLAPVGRTLATLKRLQDVLGRLHDLDVLFDEGPRLAAAEPTTATGSTSDAWRRMVASVDDERRQLHATYLRRRAGLVRVADHVSDTLTLRARRAAHTPSITEADSHAC